VEDYSKRGGKKVQIPGIVSENTLPHIYLLGLLSNLTPFGIEATIRRTDRNGNGAGQGEGGHGGSCSPLFLGGAIIIFAPPPPLFGAVLILMLTWNKKEKTT